MAYPLKKVSFSEVKKIINEEFKMAIEDIKGHIISFGNKKTVINRMKNLKSDILGNVEDIIL